MSDFVLTMAGLIGIVALGMSIQNDKKIKEDFNSGFGFRNSKLQPVIKKNGKEFAVQTDQIPNIRQLNQNKNIKESFEKQQNQPLGNGLGSNQITNSPYITPTPHLNQSINKPSPSLNLPSLIRYNPPSLNKMGITEDYQYKPSIRENYQDKGSCSKPSFSYMSGIQDNVGPNYTSSPLPTPEKNPYINVPVDGLEPVGYLNDAFNNEEVMVFDRVMTTTLKPGRFRRSGVCDLIRGDLPVAPNNHSGWFATPADPTALQKGALQAIAGENDSSTVMNKFQQMYGDASRIGSGVNLEYPVDNQYTAYEMTQNYKGVGNNTLSVSSF